MRTNKEFNSKYFNYLEEGHYGISIEVPAVLQYVDEIFNDLIKIPGFKYSQVKTKFGLSRVYTNLDEILPFVGHIIHKELEEKINLILKVEYEIEKRLLSINLDKNGRNIQPVQGNDNNT